MVSKSKELESESAFTEDELQEREEILLNESERIFVELSEKAKSDPKFLKKATKLRILCKENAEIRIRLNYANLINQMRDLHEDTFTLYDEQTSIISRYFDGKLELALDLSHTFLEPIPSIILSTKTLVSSWLRLAPSVIHNKWFTDCLPTKMLEHKRYSHRFCNMTVAVTRIVSLIITTGFKVLTRLLPNQIPERFLNDLVHSLNDFNILLKKVYLLIDYSDLNSSFGELPSPFKLDNILLQMSTFDGQYLACFIIKQIDQLTPTGEEQTFLPSIEDYFKDIEAFIKLDLRDILPAQGEEEYDRTSDYSSSSTSMSSTNGINGKLPPIIKADETLKSDGQLKKKLHSVYTTFLEHKYAVFLAMIECASTYKGLNVGFAPKTRRRRVVSWLDDCLKHQRRQLWKQYVQNLWDAYQQQLVTNLRLGKHSALCTWLCHPTFTKLIIYTVNEAMIAVPLPDDLVVPEKAQAMLGKDLEQRIAAAIIDDCLLAVRTDKGNPITENGKTTTKTWQSLKKYATLTSGRKPVGPKGSDTSKPSRMGTAMSHRSLSATPSYRPNPTACQLGHWSLATTEIRFLASYNLQGFLLNQHCEMALGRFLKTGLVPRSQRSDSIKILCSKITSYTREQMADICPPKTRWTTNKNELVNSEYVKQLCAVVLEPFEQTLPHLSASHRKEVINGVIGAFIQAWLSYFFENKIKLSNKGVRNLMQDLTVAEKWLYQSRGFGMEDLEVFDRVRTELKGTDQRHPSQISVLFHNNRVSPGLPRKRSSNPACEIQIPTSAQWQTLKTRRYFSPGVNCCTSCMSCDT